MAVDSLRTSATSASWEFGLAQPAMVRFIEHRGIRDPVLDVGCGAGDLTLELAQRGHEAWGIDLDSSAIMAARVKTEQRRLPATFRVADILTMPRPLEGFASAVDCGCFHGLIAPEQKRYAVQMHRLLRPEARLHILALRRDNDRPFDPLGIAASASENSGFEAEARTELVAAFTPGWRIEAIRPERFLLKSDAGGILDQPAWLASLRRLSAPNGGWENKAPSGVQAWRPKRPLRESWAHFTGREPVAARRPSE